MKNRLPNILTALALLALGGSASLPAADAQLPQGQYTGAGQLMILNNGAKHFHENLGICHIEIRADGSLVADFPDQTGNRLVVLPVTATAPRTVWTTNQDGQTLKVTAIPFSPELYAFQLEIWQGNRLIGGAQQFFALGRKERK